MDVLESSPRVFAAASMITSAKGCFETSELFHRWGSARAVAEKRDRDLELLEEESDRLHEKLAHAAAFQRSNLVSLEAVRAQIQANQAATQGRGRPPISEDKPGSPAPSDDRRGRIYTREKVKRRKAAESPESPRPARRAEPETHSASSRRESRPDGRTQQRARVQSEPEASSSQPLPFACPMDHVVELEQPNP